MNRTKIIILTLKEYPDRLNNLKEVFSIFEQNGFIIEIFYGVNGKNIKQHDTHFAHIKQLSYEDKIFYYDRTKRLNGRPMKNGEIGCAWSHLDIYNKLSNDKDFDNYLILEDDFKLLTSIDYLINAINNLPTYYDLCHICLSDWYNFTKKKQINEYFWTIENKFFNRTTAYIVSKIGANKLLKYSNNFINIPSDDLISNFYLFGDKKDNSNVLNFYASSTFIFKHMDVPSIIEDINKSKIDNI
jgi:GR25 family glycosyltransferase involved in LPS biosynthesis